MLYRILLCLTLFSLFAFAQPADDYNTGETWAWGYGGEESGGGSSYLGVDIADVTSERLSTLKMKEEHGAEITMVDQDAPAGKAGLREHDVILNLNGETVESAAQLRRMIKETPPGRIVTLGISRDGQPMSIKVQLADRRKKAAESGMNFPVSPIPPVPPVPEFEMPPVSIVIAHSSVRSGIMVENITPQLGEFFGVKDGNGVLIRSVEKGSRADKAGFRAGDVIVKVNKQSVHDASDFSHALRSTSGGMANVTVIREKREQNLTLKLPERRESGASIEESFDMPDLNAEVEAEMEQVSTQLAHMQPMFDKFQLEKDVWKKTMEKSRKDIEKLEEKLRHEWSGDWTEI